MILATIGLNNISADGDTNQAGKRDDSVRSGIVSTILLRFTQLADTNGGDGDAGATGEAEQDGKNDDTGRGGTQREPDTKRGNNGEEDSKDADVERADDVRVVARKNSTNDRSGVHDGDQVVGKVLVKALVEGVGGDIAQGDEEREL